MRNAHRERLGKECRSPLHPSIAIGIIVEDRGREGNYLVTIESKCALMCRIEERRPMTASMMVWKLGGAGAALLACGLTLDTGAQRSQMEARENSKAEPVLVELFTSEGCSSCPPADTLLREMNGQRTSDGQLIVGISEHVTYWNQLGWSDPYSTKDYTDRQNAYGERFHLESVYTPQMIVNGDEQLVGSDRHGLAKAIHEQLDRPKLLTIHIVSTTLESGTLTLKFSVEGSSSVKSGDVLAVIADDTDQTSVARGENSGRTLLHVAVARSITRVGRLPTSGQHTIRLPLPESFSASQHHHLILFAQMPGNGRVLDVDTTSL
jgi:hypothetical protein